MFFFYKIKVSHLLILLKIWNSSKIINKNWMIFHIYVISALLLKCCYGFPLCPLSYKHIFQIHKLFKILTFKIYREMIFFFLKQIQQFRQSLMPQNRSTECKFVVPKFPLENDIHHSEVLSVSPNCLID